MEVRPGYKKTEIGIIPEDWEVVALSKLICRLKLGGNYSNSETATGLPLIKMGNIGRGKIVLDKIEKIDKAEKPRNEDILESSDVLFNTRNTLELVGKVSIWRNELPVAYFNSNIMRITFDNDHVASNEYANYLFNSHFMLSKLRDVATGTTSVAAIYKRDLLKIKVAICPKHEQRIISVALYDIDSLISSLEKLIAKKRLIKEGVMQELLTGKRRLPGFTGEWETKRLGEVGEISGAGVDKNISKEESLVRLLNYMDVYKKDYIYSKDLNHITSAVENQLTKCSIKKGDVFFTPSSETRKDIAISAVAMENIPDAVYSYHLIRLRLIENFDLTFRTLIFKTKEFLDQAEKICEGSGKRYVITLPKFRSFQITYPKDIVEQRAISQVVYTMYKEIMSLEQQLSKYKLIKQGMMEELLTGRIRLI